MRYATHRNCGIASRAASVGLLLMLSSTLFTASPTLAQQPQVITLGTVDRNLKVGESLIMDFQGIVRAAIGDPSIADIAVLSTTQLLVNGKAPGETNLFVWDKRGQFRYRILVERGPTRLAAMVPDIVKQIGVPGVTVYERNGYLILQGKVASPYQAKRAEAIARTYSKDVENLIEVESAKAAVSMEALRVAVGDKVGVRALSDTTILLEGTATAAEQARLEKIIAALGREVQVINMVSAPAYAPRQVLVSAKVVDIDRSALSDLGVEWGAVQRTQTTGGVREEQVTIRDQPIFFGEAGLGPFALDQAGPIRRLDPLGVRLSALVSQNRARVLSEPRLLVVEGEKARILVGGEIPVPIAQAAIGLGAITIQYKEFGVKLDIKAKIADDNKSVDLNVAPEVSQLDFANAIIMSGFTVPAFRSRRAETVVHVISGGTLVIGGLYQSEDSKAVKKIPLLGDIPVIGEFFKRTSKVRRESELVIFVTPEIVTPEALEAAAKAALPAEREAK
jgi:pilus assembly protein CpaC